MDISRCFKVISIPGFAEQFVFLFLSFQWDYGASLSLSQSSDGIMLTSYIGVFLNEYFSFNPCETCFPLTF